MNGPRQALGFVASLWPIGLLPAGAYASGMLRRAGYGTAQQLVLLSTGLLAALAIVLLWSLLLQLAGVAARAFTGRRQPESRPMPAAPLDARSLRR